MGKELLPVGFVASINEILGDASCDFWDSYDSPRTHGLRLNGLKAAHAADNVKKLIRDFRLTPVPWCDTGYYYDESVRPGKHPYHAAGLYYIQEPSAMSAVELLNPQPGETILDLAAAPGGKTSHIASNMMGRGLLVSNEIHPERARILAENVERMGITNTVVTSAAPDQLSRRFVACFDRIMLDAPCSGEGMFRKDAAAIAEWSPEHVDLCVARQWDIVQEAYRMLKPGGTLAYSTCTFNTAENEEMIERMLLQYPDLELQQMKRLWPHLERGEGHFVAILVKTPAAEAYSDDQETFTNSGKAQAKSNRGGKQVPALSALADFQDWAKQDLPGFELGGGTPILFGEELYWLPVSESVPWHDNQLKGLKMPRAGLHLAHLKKNRIEPAHALAMSLNPGQAARSWDLPSDSAETAAYLRGEVLTIPSEYRGWTLVTTDGLPLGWGKASGGQLKNHLPKGLRNPK
ncbi:NOL1/NOP2/sun family putative RNA methylase [Paenibacillus sp. cl141a]|uniref:RsmB/NOP family class I SAM-dependent RNA methyltransferase n=1 Tax=Paenibacillus sp. cl141a TaxID=1761877 RepID=UPI0008B4A9CC|nr:RsmB/NOP family class I SAM-dependent RNA methyltransferase [Paenibacillus sp. cl141a]SEL03818.1 NOL1/NOP2/sun family putative RNA methylase [Paenibacillus sp. cl141a]